MVKDIQKSLRVALEGLIYAMQVWSQIAKLPVKPIDIEKDVSWNFDDSIIVDKDSELASMFADASAGIIDNVYYIMKKYGVDEKTAREMQPQQVEVKPNLYPEE